jgi:hypothetical protein
MERSDLMGLSVEALWTAAATTPLWLDPIIGV